VGFGPYVPELRSDVTRRGLDDKFTFTGALYGDDLLAALNSIDIGVSPDPKNAMNDISTMNKVVEYMMLEKPVVQFDLTEGRASAGDASLYALNNDPLDFAAKLAILIDDPERAAVMGKIGRQRALNNLSWEHSTPNLLAAYHRLFRNPGIA
jgi:glycosyltransferase involved in cell wall biosynthesis